MRHAVLGAGGVGGLLAGALARGGDEVTLLLRPASLSAYPGELTVDSAVLGSFTVPVPAASLLEKQVDVLWLTPKATGLQAALDLVPEVADALVIPLLNGVDHMGLLRQRYRNVCAGTIRVESFRVAPGRIEQRSPFIRMELSPPPADEGATVRAAACLAAAGIEASVLPDETTMMWGKLAFLAPVALATTAFDAELGAIRSRAAFGRCQDEVFEVARREGARLDDDAVRALVAAAPAAMRSSMQRDVDSGREPELDAIAGPILRGGVASRIALPSTEGLVARIRQRIGSSGADSVGPPS